MHLDAELLLRDVGHELVLTDLIPDRNDRNARSADAHAQRDAHTARRQGLFRHGRGNVVFRDAEARDQTLDRDLLVLQAAVHRAVDLLTGANALRGNGRLERLHHLRGLQAEVAGVIGA